jgi:ABC-type phosphate transport system auxiliary subunit
MPTVSTPNWARMLDEIQERLQQSLAEMAPAAASAAADDNSERERDWTVLGTKLDSLQQHIERTEELVLSADQALESTAASLRAHIDASARVRQRLAAWGGRAVG